MLRQRLGGRLDLAEGDAPARVDGDAVGSGEVALLDLGVEQRARGQDAVGRGDPPRDLGLAHPAVRRVGVAREPGAHQLRVGGLRDGVLGGQGRDIRCRDPARARTHPRHAVAAVRDDASGEFRGHASTLTPPTPARRARRPVRCVSRSPVSSGLLRGTGTARPSGHRCVRCTVPARTEKCPLRARRGAQRQARVSSPPAASRE